jgi:hypothetical protein
VILSRHRYLLVIVASAIILPSCGGGSTAGPDPGPTATPAPAPTPVPTATPVAAKNCPPVLWVPGQSYGRKEEAHFMPQLIQVQDRVFADRPDLFAKDQNGAPDPTRLRDNVWATHRAYYDAFMVAGRHIPGLCAEYAPNDAGIPDPSNSEELWIGVPGQPIDAFRVTATVPSAPVIRRYIATNYIKGYGL